MLAAEPWQDTIRPRFQIPWGLSKTACSPSYVLNDEHLPSDCCRAGLDMSCSDNLVQASCGRPSHSHLDLTAAKSREVAPYKLKVH
jgi:hypothetical protein